MKTRVIISTVSCSADDQESNLVKGTAEYQYLNV